MLPIPLPLAQNYDSLVVTPDESTVYIGLGIVGFFIVALIIAGARGNKSGRSGRSSGSGKVNKRGFRKRALAIGLSKVQISTLENLMRTHPGSNPHQIFSNQALLDRLLQQGMQDIDEQVASDAVKESQKLTLFRIKQIIERNGVRKTVLKSTKDLKPGQNLVLTPADKQKYQTKIVSNLKDAIGIETPVDTAGVQTRWQKGMPVEVYFWRSNGQGFSFTSKVLGYTRIRNTMCVLLKHSAGIKESQQRRFRRKELDRPSYFYPVRILTSGIGKKQVKKAFVESKSGALGTIMEVSAGGCSLKTNYPLKKGDLIKVEFETARGQSVKSFGKVVNFRKAPPYGGIMHIQFTRMSQSHLNNINSYVYQL
jgi:c-di-GMP-binding flagellar brake protein YcgR